MVNVMVIQTRADLRAVLRDLLFRFLESGFDYSAPDVIKAVEAVETLGERAWRFEQVSNADWDVAECIVQAFVDQELSTERIAICIHLLLGQE